MSRFRSMKPTIPLVGGIIVLATVVRLLFLGQKSFWADEVISVYFARQDWISLLAILPYEMNMTAYYALLHLWLNLGDSEFTVRMLSAIPAVATVPVLYALGARLFGAKVGLTAALLLSINAFHIRYAQEARSYSMLILLITTSSLLFLKSVARPTPRSWTAYILATVLAAYSHFFALLVLAAHWASLPFLRGKPLPWRALILSTLIIGFLLLPIPIFAVDIGQIDRIGRPTLRTIAHIFSALPGADRFPGTTGAGEFFTLAGASRTLLLLSYIVLWCLGIITALRWVRSSNTFPESWYYGFLLTWTGVPIALALGISMVKPVAMVRYFAVCLPPALLLAAIGLARVRPRWVFAGVLVIIVGLASHRVIAYYESDKEDWRGATRYIVSQVKPGDAVLLPATFIWMAFNYYHDRLQAPTSSVSILVLLGPQERYLPPETRYPEIIALSYPDDLPRAYDRVWVLLSHHMNYQFDGPIFPVLGRRYLSVTEKTFSYVKVRLYNNPQKPGFP